MRKKANYQPLLLALFLIFAGILSPSNGVDDIIYKTPFELITTMLVIISAGLALNLLWNGIEKHKESLKTNYKSNEQNTLTSN